MDNIQVAIRARPLIAKETSTGQNKVWNIKENTLEPLDQNGKPGIPYTFDRIFDEHMTTYDVFQEIAKPIIDAAVQGFHGTIFAYGQSSSGKTFTMSGDAIHPGIIKLAVNEIFTRIDKIPDREYLVRCCYMEIYNEKVSDLLSTEDKIIKIQEDTERNVNVIGVVERYVMNEDDLNAVLKEGEARRHMAETKQNDRSSRSHCILRIIIESRQVDDESAVMVAHLNFVDLAGSEKAGENTGDRFREGCSINKSLFTLARIIAKLSEGVSNQHIGYRDSKLTRILQNALGGNSKTAVIATITPASLEESHSTLKFATRAKTISNKPKINEVLSDAALLKRSHIEIQKLQEKIKAMGNTDVCELQGEKEDLEKKLKEKEEMEQKYHDLLNSLKYVIQSGTTQHKIIPQPKRRKTWCPGKGGSVSSPRRFSFINRMSFFNEAEEINIEDISPPHPRKRHSDGKVEEPVKKKHVTFPNVDPVPAEEEDEAFLVDPLARDLLDLQDKYESLLQDYEELKREKTEMDEYHCLELETNQEGLDRMTQLEESEKKNREEMEAVKKELTDLEEKFIEKAQTMKSMEEKMNTLSDENFHLEHQLQIQNRKVKEYQSELGEVRKQEEGQENVSQVEKLNSANEKLGSEVEELRSSNEGLKTEVEKLKSANSEQMLEMEKLKTLNEELKEHQATVETLNSRIHEYEKTIKVFEETVDEFQVENKQLQDALEEKIQKMEELRAAAESKAGDNCDIIQEMEQRVVMMEEEIKEHISEKETLQAKTQHLEEALMEVRQNLDDAKNVKEEAEELEDVKMLLEEAIAKIKELEEKVEEQVEEIKGLSTMVEEKQIDLRNQVKDKDCDLDILKESHRESERVQAERIRELETELQQTLLKHTEELSVVRRETMESIERYTCVESEGCVRCKEREVDEELHDSQQQTEHVQRVDVSVNVCLEEDVSTERFINDEEKVRLEEKIVELEEKLVRMEQDKENLKDPAELMEQFQNIVEVMKREHAKEIAKMQEDYKSPLDKNVMEELEQLRSQCEELAQTLTEKDITCKELKEAVTEKEALCVELHDRIMQSENLSGHDKVGDSGSCQKCAENISDSQKVLALEQEVERLQECTCKLKEENEDIKRQNSMISNLQDEINNLQIQLSENESKISNLQVENERLVDCARTTRSSRRHGSESSSCISQGHSESMDYTEMCERLSMENITLQERVEELQDQMKNYQQEVEFLEDHLKEAQEESRVSRDKVWELEEKLISQTSCSEFRLSQETQTENLTGDKQLEERASQTENLTGDKQLEERASQTDDQGDLVLDSQRSDTDINNTKIELQLLLEENVCLREKLSSLEEEARKLREQEQTTSRQEETWVQEFTSLKGIHEELEGRFQDVNKNWADAEEKVLELQQSLEETKELVANLTTKHEQSQEEIESYQRKIETLQDKVSTLSDQTERNDEEIESYQRKIETLQDKVSILSDQTERNDATWQELEEVKQTMASATEEVHTLKLRNMQLESTVREKENELADEQDQHQFLQAEVDRLKSEIESTLREKENELADEQDQRHFLQAEVERLKSDIESTVREKENELADAKDQRQFLQAEVERLKSDIESTVRENENKLADEQDQFQSQQAEVERPKSDIESTVREKNDLADEQDQLQSQQAEVEHPKSDSESTVREKNDLADEQDQLQSQQAEVEHPKSDSESTVRRKNHIAAEQARRQSRQEEFMQNLVETYYKMSGRRPGMSVEEELEFQVNEKDSIIKNMEKEIQTMENKFTTYAMSMHQELEDKKTELQEKKTEKNQEILSLQTRIQSLLCQLEDNEAKLKHTNHQNISNDVQEELQAKLDEKNKELASLQAQFQTLQGQAEKEGVQELQHAISELEVKVQHYSHRCGNLEQLVEKLQSGANVSETLQKELEQMKTENATLRNERDNFQLEERMKRSKLVSEFNSLRLTIKRQEKSIQDLIKESDEVDIKAAGKEVMDKLAKEEAENDKLWADIGVKDREIERLQKYQIQVADLTKQVAELKGDKSELERRLRDSRNNAGRIEETVFTPHATELADKKRENFALRMQLEKVQDSVKSREEAYSETVDRYEKRISSLKNEIRRLQQDTEATVVVPSATRKTLFQEAAEKPSDLSNSSMNDSGVVSRSSYCGAMDQYCNLMLKNENARLEKENKKLLKKLTQIQTDTDAHRSKENLQQKRYQTSEEIEKVSSAIKKEPRGGKEIEKVSSAIKREPLEDSNLAPFDFSIPKVTASVPVQSRFRMPESTRGRDVPSDHIKQEDTNEDDNCKMQ